MEKSRFYNEFADWTSQALQAERLAAIDQLAMTSIRDLLEAIVANIRKHLEGDQKARCEWPPGDEFHFCEAQSFIMPTGQVAHNVADFLAVAEGFR